MKGIKSKVIKKYIEKYPNLPNLTLAKLIYKKEHLLYPNLNSIRSLIIKVKKMENIKTVKRQYVVPKGIKNFYDVFEIKGTYKILLLSDLHIPFHDDRSIVKILSTNEKFDFILLNGDILDAYSLSKYVVDPRLRNFADEIKITKELLQYIRNKFKKSHIIFKYGNHEERYEKYLFHKAPELFGIEEYELNRILSFEKFGIEYVNNKRPIKVNELYVLHGHEIGNSAYSPVNPARTIYLRTKKNTIVGHYHQPSTHQEPSLDKKFITCWSTGCLCDLNPNYIPINKWATGYAVIETNGSKEFNVSNYKLIEGKIYRT